jgi:hypothetical protein
MDIRAEELVLNLREKEWKKLQKKSTVEKRSEDEKVD